MLFEKTVHCIITRDVCCETIVETNSLSELPFDPCFKGKYYNHTSPLEDQRAYSPWQQNVYSYRIYGKQLVRVEIQGVWNKSWVSDIDK